VQQENSHLKKADNLAEIRKYAFDVLRYWYLFVIVLAIALGWAWYKNRYTPRIYPVGMSLLIRSESNLGNSAALLYQNPILDAKPNHYDQAHLIKADPLLTQVVEELNFGVNYFQEGNIRTSEYYPGLPLHFEAIGEGAQLPFGSSFLIQLNGESHFYFREKREDDKQEFAAIDLHAFGDTLSYGGRPFRVVKAKGFRFNDFFNQPFIVSIHHPASVAGGYSGRLQVSWVERGSGMLKLGLNGAVAQKEIDFLNTLAAAFIEQDVQKKTQNASKTIRFIDEQLAEISDSLFRVEKRLEQFKEKNYRATLGEESAELFVRLQELEGNKSSQNFRQRYFDYLIDYIQKERTGTDVIVPASIGLEDPVLNSLIEKLVELQLKREELSRSTNWENPYLQGVNAQLADLKSNIIENIENQQRNILLEQKNLEGKVQRLEKEVQALPAAEREYVNIRRLYSLSEDLYLFLMRKRAEAGITQASTSSDISVVNPAKLLGGPISPNTGKNYVMALLIGLAIPFGFIFARRYLNDKIQTKEELLSLTTIPFLGVVGHKEKGSNLVFTDRPKSAVAESFRSIRSNIQFFTSGKQEMQNRTIVITSSVSGEGKTFCSINLASVYAISGKRTVLIGADLRKPKIFDDFGLQNEPGLSNYLIKQAELKEVLQATGVAGLDIISGGIIPPNPGELLMSRRMQELLLHLQQQYDVIIIDTPPVGLVADAFGLMEQADHTLFVVRQNYTKMEQVNELNKMAESGKIKNSSLVLNDAKVQSYSYGYGYGYGYYDEGPSGRWKFAKRFFGQGKGRKV
jgi:capsular exopolysaccharide synthesis family protein